MLSLTHSLYVHSYLSVHQLVFFHLVPPSKGTTLSTAWDTPTSLAGFWLGILSQGTQVCWVKLNVIPVHTAIFSSLAGFLMIPFSLFIQVGI
jgi:apolipoprotein N-acyltransferase